MNGGGGRLADHALVQNAAQIAQIKLKKLFAAVAAAQPALDPASYEKHYNAGDLLAASEIEERHRLTFRHAQIVVAARKSSATLLLSDDRQPYRPITGLEVRNPFS